MENFWPSHLYAVVIEHKPADCPLSQRLPDDAFRLAENLDRIDSHGVFSMRQHFGVDLVKTKTPKDLSDIYAGLLPKHLPVFIVDIDEDDRLRYIYDHAKQLDTDEKLRLALFNYMSDHINFLNFQKTIEEKLPTRSLKTLPEFLRSNAPAVATHVGR